MAEFLTSLRSIATKAETIPGNAVALVSADSNIRIWDLAIGSLDVPMDMDPSKYATGDLGLGESIPGPTSAKITGTTKFVNKTGALEPNWTKLIKACGCLVANYTGVLGNGTSNSGYLIYPSATALENTITAGIYDLERGASPSGLFYQFAGCIGNATFAAEGTGKPITVKYEFTGALNDIEDISGANIPVLTSADTEIPDRFLNGFMWTSGTANSSGCISTFEFNMGHTVASVECQSSATGYSKFAITKAEPMLTINPLTTRNSTYDFWSKLTSGTIEAVKISTAMFTLFIPRAQLMSAAPGDADGLQRTAITMRPLRPTSSHSVMGYASWGIFIKS
jgi:hypothetical protein